MNLLYIIQQNKANVFSCLKNKKINRKEKIMIKHQKDVAKSVRISSQMNSKLVAYAEKHDLSEAHVIRMALKKFLPTNTAKHSN